MNESPDEKEYRDRSYRARARRCAQTVEYLRALIDRVENAEESAKKMLSVHIKIRFEEDGVEYEETLQHHAADFIFGKSLLG